MRLAIMQPYVFPYVGYFQLLSAVDTFVIYDDVDFIKQGWIARNNILLNGQSHLFSIPLEGASSYKKINEVGIHPQQYPKWRKKFLRTIEQQYRKAPAFDSVFPLVQEVFCTEGLTSIGELARESIKKTAEYLEVPVRIKDTSSVYQNERLAGQDRVIDICLKEGAEEYINVRAGSKLYNHNDFEQRDIRLSIIEPAVMPYAQFNGHFVGGLSIIDVLMFNDKEGTKEQLNNYQLVTRKQMA